LAHRGVFVGVELSGGATLAFLKMEPGKSRARPSQDDGTEETLALIEGAGDVKDSRKGSLVRREMQESGESGDLRKGDALLASLLLQSVSFCVAAIIVARMANSLAVLVELVTCAGDSVSYISAMVAALVVRNESEAQRERIECRVAVLNSFLLVAFAGWVMVRIYLNLKCAEDNTYHFQMGGEKFHAPCAFLQARPDADMVLLLECICFVSYVPALVIGWWYTRWEYYSPTSNISHSSAVLHAFVDFSGIIIFTLAALCMKWFSYDSVYIDAIASTIVICLIISSTTVMWVQYFRSFRDPEKVLCLGGDEVD